MKPENRDEYRKRNFENLVKFYEKEIKCIHKGEPILKILSRSERGTLLRSGILFKRGSGSCTEWKVSKQALNLLSTNKKHTREHPLDSGIPCKIHRCVKCCLDTNMQLTSIDIERILKHGYRFKDFVVKDKGDHYLKNHNNRCVFLGDNECIIYLYRPEGCRLYPLVYDENYGIGEIHDFCPHSHEFKVTREDTENLHILYKKFKSE